MIAYFYRFNKAKSCESFIPCFNGRIRFFGNQHATQLVEYKEMEVTYSSSFESEDDEVAQVEKEKKLHLSKDSSFKIEENNSDIDFLCKGVNDLPLISNTNLKMIPKTYWVVNKISKRVKEQCGTKNFLKNKTVKVETSLYIKRSICNGSTSINRRKQLKQIEHDNLVNVKIFLNNFLNVCHQLKFRSY